MAKNDERHLYEKNKQDYLRITKKDKDGNTKWQKDIPMDKTQLGSGAHIIYGREDQFHYDFYYEGQEISREYKDVNVAGSTAVGLGDNIFLKSPDEDFHCIPIAGSISSISIDDQGERAIVKTSSEGKVFFVTTPKKEDEKK